MKRKLEIHLLPHFGHITVSELTSRDVEAYLDRKLAENRRMRLVVVTSSCPTGTCSSGADGMRSGAAASWRCASRPWTSGGRNTRPLALEGAELRPVRLRPRCWRVTRPIAMQLTRVRGAARCPCYPLRP